MSTLTYITNMLKDRYVASITPTSQAGVRHVCRCLDVSRHNVIVEYGPGTGVFTHYLLRISSPESKLILIERNSSFVSILQRTFRHEPRVRIYHDSAEHVRDILKECREPHADYVLSGIPFLLFPEEVRDRIVAETYHSLRPGGKFLPYQTCFQRDRHLKHHLERYFTRVTSGYFLRNVPPMRVYEAVK